MTKVPDSQKSPPGTAVLSRFQKAYQDGREARIRGWPILSNPYGAALGDLTLTGWWADGWTFEDDHQKNLDQLVPEPKE